MLHSQRMEELHDQLSSLETQLKEATTMLEKRTEENYTLK